MADLSLLLTPRQLGGHELALLGWLKDAVRQEGLQPAIYGADAHFAAACEERGLQRHLARQRGEALVPMSVRARADWALKRLPRGVPLLLAPGVLHAQAWLLARALARGHTAWVYVPMAYTARHMGYRHAALRDRLLAPWLRRVSAWITIDDRQSAHLRHDWGVTAPIHVLPNRVRLPQGPGPQPPADDGGGLRVAVVGRFEPWQKGLDWLAAQIAGGAEWTRGSRWHFQGAGPGEAALLELASAQGPQRLQVHGHAPLDQALAANDLLLLPSRYEGLPLVALEASHRGWPVVASHEAGLQHLLPAASQFAFGDAQGLAQALASLARPQARAAAAAHAQRRLPGVLQAERYWTSLRGLTETWRRLSREARSANRSAQAPR